MINCGAGYALDTVQGRRLITTAQHEFCFTLSEGTLSLILHFIIWGKEILLCHSIFTNDYYSLVINDRDLIHSSIETQRASPTIQPPISDRWNLLPANHHTTIYSPHDGSCSSTTTNQCGWKWTTSEAMEYFSWRGPNWTPEVIVGGTTPWIKRTKQSRERKWNR